MLSVSAAPIRITEHTNALPARRDADLFLSKRPKIQSLEVRYKGRHLLDAGAGTPLDGINFW